MAADGERRVAAVIDEDGWLLMEKYGYYRKLVFRAGKEAGNGSV